MGQKPMPWTQLATYVRQLRGLLAGEVVDIDGGACRMLHSPGWGAARPMATPIWLAPGGPKGFAVASELADGIIVSGPVPEQDRGWDSCALLVFGTVVRPGEDHLSPRLIDAAGPCFATTFHGAWEYFPAALDNLPGGTVWREAMEAAGPERERHLAVHEGHLTYMTQRDREAVAAAGPAILRSGWT